MNETALVQRDSNVAVYEPPMTAQEIRAQVNRIQEVMRDVMKPGVHFGNVPGTDKPSLWKPGAEKLGMTFHIAIDPQIDADLSNDDVIRYRVRATATSQATGAFLGAALGECSSHEEKYKWRTSVCGEEFEETTIDRRRKKWKRGKDNAYSILQIRTEPADIANTVLKMAVKRAVVAAILQVTAASDIFTQDIEDLPDEIRDEVQREERPVTEKSQAEQKKSSPSGDAISEPQRARAFAIGKAKGWSVEQYRDVVKRHGFDSDKNITKGAAYNAICAELERGPTAAAESNVPAGFKS